MKIMRSPILFLAVVTILPLSAHAQFQINNGNAADANTRAGSYGSNGYSQQGPINSATVNGNQIVTGNVTGGRALQTNPGYFAPGQLETTTGDEQFQQFVRDSVGVPPAYQQTQPGYVASQPFYGASTTATPPAGFVRNSVTGSYVPAAAPAPQMGYDTRINIPPIGGALPADVGLTPTMSVIPQTSMVSGAQLYGPQVTPGELEQTASPYGGGYKQWSPQDQLSINQQSLEQMRAELNQPPGAQQSNTSGNGTASPNTPPGVTPGALGTQSLTPGPLDTQVNTSITTPTLVANGQTASQQQQLQQPAMMTPAQQSSQYAQMQQRFQELANGSPSALPGNDILKQNNGAATAAPTPGIAENPADVQKRRQAELYPPSVPATTPLLIHSLAAGIHARGLRSLMADAEEHMRQGKFAEALIRYAGAYQVAPNNPLVPLGRSFAELGAGYYARADRDLRGALQTDPVLLVGRYDLRNFLGSDRLEYVVRDLKQIAASDKQNASAPFLSAYIAYNTGSATAAGEYLNLADQRSSTASPLFGLMRQYWGLPAAAKK